ncbi:MAG: hypothetical protein ACJ8LD_20000 [Pantoea agglomerans]
MAELRAGGLALIINSRIPENIGRTVKLIRYLGMMKGNVMKVSMAAWECQSASGENLKGFMPTGAVRHARVIDCPSDWLMPIDGEDFQHEDEQQKELTHG